jgi:aryl-alcohol dehydrogenase-like predicted oxidoreductase
MSGFCRVAPGGANAGKQQSFSFRRDPASTVRRRADGPNYQPWAPACHMGGSSDERRQEHSQTLPGRIRHRGLRHRSRLHVASGVYGTSTDEEGIALIHQALDCRITLLDTSDMYGFGHNEELVGQAIKGRRVGVVLATKFGNLGGREGKIAEGRPDYVISACEKSLKRLGVDVIDLYYQHRVDPTVPVEETFGAMAQLVAQGKVRALGISEARPETIRRAHAVHPVAAVQNEFSLLYRTEAEETLHTTRALNITFVAYSPLGRGLLTGAVAGQSDLAEADARRRHPRFAPENLGRNVALVQRIEEIARAKKCTLGQLALAWLLARGEDIVPIPGTKRPERLKENVGALGVTLSEAELAQISDAIPVGAAAGLRYPEAQMKSVYL